MKRITGFKEPQGIAYVESRDSLYVANGGDGSVSVFHGPDYTSVGRIELGADADNIRVDSAQHRLLVGYGAGGIAAIDLVNNAKTASFPLRAHPESFQIDDASQRIFVNTPDARSITVLNKGTGQQGTKWEMPYGANFAMALDNERHRVLVAFRNPAKLVAFDKNNGSLVGEADLCGDADDLFLDPKRSRIYVTCGAGFIDVLDTGGQAFGRLARIPTVSGARTGLFVPEIDKLVLGVRARLGEPAAIWVYGPIP